MRRTTDLAFFQFGGQFLKDKPNHVQAVLKDSRVAHYDLDEGHAMMLNPGEPILYMESFTVSGSEDRHLRIVEVLPWDVISRIVFEYPPIDKTDPEVWKTKPVDVPGAQPTRLN
jgi:hypothetical protein